MFYRRPRQGSILLVLLSMLMGCTLQAPYMRSWDLAEGINNRWTGGTFDAKKFSADEAAVYKELGTPETVRYFRTVETRQPVYAWIYLKREQHVWFVEGKRVDYVAVDTNTSGYTKEYREALEDKATTGGIVAGAVGGLAAGFILLGNKIGLRD